MSCFFSLYVTIPNFSWWSANSSYRQSREIKAHFLKDSTFLVTKPYCVGQNKHE